jgi:ATP:cob(I)alamin adenosyltransferase
VPGSTGPVASRQFEVNVNAKETALIAVFPAGPLADRRLALAHVCRTACRRAERALVALGKQDKVNDGPRQYLNRLSDLMFVLARVLNRYAGGTDVQWQQRKNQ